MNYKALIKAKRDLFHQLILKNYESYTPEEIGMLSYLLDDKDIQDYTGTGKQAGQLSQTQTGCG